MGGVVNKIRARDIYLKTTSLIEREYAAVVIVN